jgi:hypothetical protein
VRRLVSRGALVAAAGLAGGLLPGPAAAFPLIELMIITADGRHPDTHVIVGFGTATDPALPQIDLRDPAAVKFTVPDKTNPETFQLYFTFLQGVGDVRYLDDPLGLGVKAGYRFGFQGARPTHGDGHYGWDAELPGEPGKIQVTLGFTTDSGGVLEPASIRAIPPAEHPLDLPIDESIAMFFGYTRLSDASVTVQLTDENGQALRLALIPEPGALALLLTALLGLGALQRRGS